MKISLLDVEEINDYNSLDYVYQVNLFGVEVGRIKLDASLYEFEVREVFLKYLSAPALSQTAKYFEGEVID